MPGKTRDGAHAPKAAERGRLRLLRREAGYASAREFAREVGISSSAYARYERAEAAPECGIPMASAWRIADALGASIDEVVGRSAGAEAPVQRRYDRLGERSRRALDEVLLFLEQRELMGAGAARERPQGGGGDA